MRYCEFAPAAPLSRYIQCFWALESDSAGAAPASDPQPVLPDGRMELVFHYGDAFQRIHSGTTKVEGTAKVERQPRALLAGQIRSGILLRPTGRVGVIGARFRPGAAYCFLRFPQNELADMIVDFSDFQRSLAMEITERLAEAPARAQRIALLEGALLTKLPGDGLDKCVEAAVTMALGAGGCVSVDELARHAGLGARQLERKFHQRVGIGPKLFCRIARFQRAIGALERGGVSPLAAALDCGYYDQSHFIADFKEFAGCPPSVFFRERRELAAYFISGSPA